MWLLLIHYLLHTQKFTSCLKGLLLFQSIMIPIRLSVLAFSDNFWRQKIKKLRLKLIFSKSQNLNLYVNSQYSIFLVFWEKKWIFWYFWRFLKKHIENFFEIYFKISRPLKFFKRYPNFGIFWNSGIFGLFWKIFWGFFGNLFWNSQATQVLSKISTFWHFLAFLAFFKNFWHFLKILKFLRFLNLHALHIV